MRLKLFLLVRVDRWRSLNESAFDMILLFLGVWFSHASRSGILGAFSFLIEGLELVDSPKQALLWLRDFASYQRHCFDKIKVDLVALVICQTLHKATWLLTVNQMIWNICLMAKRSSFWAHRIIFVLEKICLSFLQCFLARSIILRWCRCLELGNCHVLVFNLGLIVFELAHMQADDFSIIHRD